MTIIDGSMTQFLDQLRREYASRLREAEMVGDMLRDALVREHLDRNASPVRDE